MAIDIIASFINQDGVAFPNSAAVNASGGAATDGTEFVKLMIDNYMFGPQQALLNYAGLTPTGVTESNSASQTIEALIKGFGIGPGMGVTYWKDGDPAANGDRVLLLNGQGVLIASYVDLDAEVYVGDGNNAAVAAGGGFFYRASDAAGTTPNIAGPYLILPDARGATFRGLDVAAAIDPDGASRFLGDFQGDTLQGFITYSGLATGASSGSAVYGITPNDLPGAATTINQNTAGSALNQNLSSGPKDDLTNGTPRTSSESRMTNISTNYGITY